MCWYLLLLLYYIFHNTTRHQKPSDHDVVKWHIQQLYCRLMLHSHLTHLMRGQVGEVFQTVLHSFKSWKRWWTPSEHSAVLSWRRSQWCTNLNEHYLRSIKKFLDFIWNLTSSKFARMWSPVQLMLSRRNRNCRCLFAQPSQQIVNSTLKKQLIYCQLSWALVTPHSQQSYRWIQNLPLK